MKLNTAMPKNIKPFYQEEINKYSCALHRHEMAKAWHHLERAHVIGQRFPIQHTETHWKMLLLGCRTGNFKEIIGQVVRLVFGAPLSFINQIPVGNVGSSRVSMTKPQPIPKDIQEVFME
ncbi:MAG: DUF3703 domain-containing protein [Reichenbachiella sp.]|uniref:DUF3703 domain-containing protein n=1 Tax=Reichenbachiella sp. TaxID=2184521 RepID=UPI002965E510|nr:DUF3703 domain-containing protein [Reichenbachiella sp.]MDW3208518.1 DUF3703 domain-containing protein [Reichenbachiella sp.]